jgi:hypothetical protein
MSSPREFESLLKERLPFLHDVEESLRGRVPVICTDLSQVNDGIITPVSLQHVGEQIVETAKADWTGAKGLRTVVAYLGELLDFWKTIFRRHHEAAGVFTAAEERPYSLFLLSFSEVTTPIEVPGARAVLYINDPSLPANLAATLMGEADWLNPVSCLHTDDMQLLGRSGLAMPSFRVHTINWKDILDNAIASSGTILFYVGGPSPGVKFEIERVRQHRLGPRTVLVHKGTTAPGFCHDHDYAAVMSVNKFLDGTRKKTGPGTLSKTAKTLLRNLTSSAITRRAPSQQLLTMPCDIVDPDVAADCMLADPEKSYFVTPSNAAAFMNYVQNLPDSLLRWNAISQDIRLRNIQPTLNDFNALYLALRMAFMSATCLGFTASIALTTGLLCKVASMAKPNQAENEERVKHYMSVLDIAGQFDALTTRKVWGDKIEAFRDSILEDPFMGLSSTAPLIKRNAPLSGWRGE